MRRPETRKKLDEIAAGDRWVPRMAFVFAILAGFVIMMLGYYPGAYVGRETATVVWSEMTRSWKSIEPISHMRAKLSKGAEIYATSPHTPPPVPGDRIVIDVRRNILGWHSYTWQPGKPPEP